MGHTQDYEITCFTSKYSMMDPCFYITDNEYPILPVITVSKP